MNTSGIDQVLAQMRLMAAQAGTAQGAETSRPDASFGDLLKQTIDQVNNTQQQAGELKRAFEMGDDSVNLAQVMVAVQKSSLSFETMLQARNKLVDAYKEVMNMPI